MKKIKPPSLEDREPLVSMPLAALSRSLVACFGPYLAVVAALTSAPEKPPPKTEES